jgi:hypothetical protein
MRSEGMICRAICTREESDKAAREKSALITATSSNGRDVNTGPTCIPEARHLHP